MSFYQTRPQNNFKRGSPGYHSGKGRILSSRMGLHIKVHSTITPYV